LQARKKHGSFLLPGTAFLARRLKKSLCAEEPRSAHKKMINEVTAMQVVLKQDVKELGKKGQLVSVSHGYARNYLFPRGLASEANAQAINELKSREAAVQYRQTAEKAAAEAAAAGINGKTLKISARAGGQGRLFGSVTAKEIAEQLRAQFGLETDKRKIALAEDIKAFGTYAVDLKLLPGVTASFYVLVGD
jgi:large subunit ribosomal protein L9